MPQNTTINLPAGEWVLLTDADVTACTFQVASSARLPVLIAGAVGAVAPTTTAGSITYDPSEGEYNIPLSEMFPGIAATRLYAYSSRETSIFVSHS